MARCRADWRQIVDPETGHWCWHSQLRQESRWEKPPISEGWLEWRDANGNAFYVDDNGASTWDPPWADEDGGIHRYWPESLTSGKLWRERAEDLEGAHAYHEVGDVEGNPASSSSAGQA